VKRTVRIPATCAGQAEGRRPGDPVVILVLLFLNFGRIAEALIVMLSVPFALFGGASVVW
jgi:hypothetical protein